MLGTVADSASSRGFVAAEVGVSARDVVSIVSASGSRNLLVSVTFVELVKPRPEEVEPPLGEVASPGLTATASRSQVVVAFAVQVDLAELARSLSWASLGLWSRGEGSEIADDVECGLELLVGKGEVDGFENVSGFDDQLFDVAVLEDSGDVLDGFGKIPMNFLSAIGIVEVSQKLESSALEVAEDVGAVESGEKGSYKTVNIETIVAHFLDQLENPCAVNGADEIVDDRTHIELAASVVVDNFDQLIGVFDVARPEGDFAE